MKGGWVGLLFGLALAQPGLVVVQGPQGVAALVDSAEREVLLSTPALREVSLAQALGRAVAERGLAVYVLAGRAEARAADSYLPWLWLHTVRDRYPNLRIRVAAGEPPPFLVVDRRVVLQGPLLWRRPGPLVSVPMVVETDPARVAARLARFGQLYAQGRAFQYTPVRRP